MYEYGGIYIDADSVWINNKNFDELLIKVNKTGVFVSTHVENDIICGGVMGSTKENILMKQLIVGIIKHIIQYKKDKKVDIELYKRKRKNYGVSRLIGSLYLNDCLKMKNVTIFPSEYFYTISWHGINDINKHNTISISSNSFTFQYGYTTNNLQYLFNVNENWLKLFICSYYNHI